MDEQLKSLAEELQLSDELFIKLKLVVEGFADEKIQSKVDELNEMHQNEIEVLTEQNAETVKSLEDEIEYIQEKAEAFGEMLQEKAEAFGEHIYESTLAESENYAEYVVEKFIEDNKESFLKEDEYKRMKKTFELIKESFQENLFDIEVQDSKLKTELTEAKEQYEELFEDFKTIKSELEKVKKEHLFESKTKSLAETQKEKVTSLLESINAKSTAEYGKAIDIIVSELDKKGSYKKTLTEDLKLPKPASDDRMSKYVEQLSK
jgi:hypothetical protein